MTGETLGDDADYWRGADTTEGVAAWSAWLQKNEAKSEMRAILH